MTDRGNRHVSAVGRLARLGFADPERAAGLLADPALAGLVDPLEDLFADGLLAALRAAADPDLALSGLVRLLEAASRDAAAADPARLRAVLRSGGDARDRLLAVLGASDALGDHLAATPGTGPCCSRTPPIPTRSPTPPGRRSCAPSAPIPLRPNRSPPSRPRPRSTPCGSPTAGCCW